MVTPTVSKLINKVAWTARGFGRSAPIEVLYLGGSKDRPEYIKRIRGPVYLEPQHGYAITADGVLVEETIYANFPVPGGRRDNSVSARTCSRRRR
jgi:hypothetical protein